MTNINKAARAHSHDDLGYATQCDLRTTYDLRSRTPVQCSKKSTFKFPSSFEEYESDEKETNQYQLVISFKNE